MIINQHDHLFSREKAMELFVFLFLIVPSMILSLFLTQGGTANFTILAISTIIRDLGLLFLVLYFVWKNGESLYSIGWNFRRPGDEIILGAFLFFPTSIFISIFQTILQNNGLHIPEHASGMFHRSGHFELVLAIIMVIVVAVVEETVFRGYLILRFRQITSNVSMSVIFSTVVFAMGHGYEGAAGIILVFMLGVIFAVIYIWRKSLLAPMTMHFLQDFLGIVVFYGK
jgi:membrane protease YdiL (CAAX protease family)